MRRPRLLPFLMVLVPLVAACGDDSGPTADAGTADGTVDATDAALGDAAILPDDAGDAAAPYTGPTRYPPDQVSSPVSTSVVARMEAIYAANPAPNDDVFMKVGASGTVSTHLLYCFAGAAQPQYDLTWDGRDALQPTVDWFRGGDAAGDTPFDRPTLAAESGRTAAWVMSGAPSPLEQEIAAIHPSFAFVNYGTNDMQMGITYRSALFPFYENFCDLLDSLEDQGIIPLISGLNPRADSTSAAQWVPTYDVVTRGIAEARQVPYLSLYLMSRDLPDQGLVSDGVHGNTYVDGTSQPCVFTAAGLEYNYNGRNLRSVQMLDDVRQTVLEAQPAPDPPTPPAAGSGTRADPVIIDGLPFTHAGDTRVAPESTMDDYPACDSGQDESGGEVVYRLELAASTPLRMIVLDRGDVDVDLHLLGASADPAGCLDRADRILETTLDAGTYHLVVDTYVPSDGIPRAGEYLLVVLPCEAGDPDCQ